LDPFGRPVLRGTSGGLIFGELIVHSHAPKEVVLLGGERDKPFTDLLRGRCLSRLLIKNKKEEKEL